MYVVTAKLSGLKPFDVFSVGRHAIIPLLCFCALVSNHIEFLAQGSICVCFQRIVVRPHVDNGDMTSRFVVDLIIFVLHE